MTKQDCIKLADITVHEANSRFGSAWGFPLCTNSAGLAGRELWASIGLSTEFSPEATKQQFSGMANKIFEIFLDCLVSMNPCFEEAFSDVTLKIADSRYFKAPRSILDYDPSHEIVHSVKTEMLALYSDYHGGASGICL